MNEQTLIRTNGTALSLGSAQTALAEANESFKHAIEESKQQIVQSIQELKESVKGCEARFDLVNEQQIIVEPNGKAIFSSKHEVHFAKDK